MDRKSHDNFKYAALEHGLSSRHNLHPDGVTDSQAFDNLLTAYRDDYAPETVAETEAVFSLVETQWQLTRVRRLLDLAFSRGGTSSRPQRDTRRRVVAPFPDESGGRPFELG